MSDLIQIPPHEFYKRSRDAVEDKINAKYSDRVIQKIGHCICMYDLLRCSDGRIGHGTGLVNINAEFRLIVFRPSKGEVMHARIASCTATGIRLSTEFFGDIHVGPKDLFPNCEFHEGENAWIWHNDDGEEPTELFFDQGDTVRFRVEAEEWSDASAKAPVLEEGLDGVVERKSPYKIIGSMAQPGLGNVLWW